MNFKSEFFNVIVQRCWCIEWVDFSARNEEKKKREEEKERERKQREEERLKKEEEKKRLEEEKAREEEEKKRKEEKIKSHFVSYFVKKDHQPNTNSSGKVTN